MDELFDSALRVSDIGALVRVDPGQRTIGLSLYQGLLTFLLIHQNLAPKRKQSMSTSTIVPGTILEAVSFRDKVLNLIDFVFLEEQMCPTIVVLSKDQELQRFISLREIDKMYKPSDRDLLEKKWSDGQLSIMVDRTASLLIPTRNGIP